jgi:hypothetical protein
VLMTCTSSEARSARVWRLRSIKYELRLASSCGGIVHEDSNGFLQYFHQRTSVCAGDPDSIRQLISAVAAGRLDVEDAAQSIEELSNGMSVRCSSPLGRLPGRGAALIVAT